MKQRLPRIYLEHDPPREVPTDTRHPVDDPNVLLVHVTPFNELMWDSGRTPTRVIEHGVAVADDVTYTGELGADVFEHVRARVPLDLVGMESEEVGGLGEIPHHELPAFAARYRFLFNPIRYTSLGLAVCEAMAAGVPIVGLATTEMSTAVENGVSGYVDTRVDVVVGHMRRLLADLEEARRLSGGARRSARERFGLARFVADWEDVLAEATGTRSAAAA